MSEDRKQESVWNTYRTKSNLVQSIVNARYALAVKLFVLSQLKKLDLTNEQYDRCIERHDLLVKHLKALCPQDDEIESTMFLLQFNEAFNALSRFKA